MRRKLYEEIKGVNVKLAEAIAYAELGNLEKINYERLSFEKTENVMIIEYTPVYERKRKIIKKHNNYDFIENALMGFIELGLICEEDFDDYVFKINSLVARIIEDIAKLNKCKININIEDSLKDSVKIVDERKTIPDDINIADEMLGYNLKNIYIQENNNKTTVLIKQTEVGEYELDVDEIVSDFREFVKDENMTSTEGYIYENNTLSLDLWRDKSTDLLSEIVNSKKNNEDIIVKLRDDDGKNYIYFITTVNCFLEVI